MDESFVRFVEGMRGGLTGDILFLGAIVDGCAGKRSVLWTSGFGVIELLEGFATYPGMERCTCHLV